MRSVGSREQTGHHPVAAPSGQRTLRGEKGKRHFPQLQQHGGVVPAPCLPLFFLFSLFFFIFSFPNRSTLVPFFFLSLLG